MNTTKLFELVSPVKGGGQVLRLLFALLFSLANQGFRSVSLSCIRAIRPTPGLHAQAMAGIETIRQLFPALVFEGAELSSQTLKILFPEDLVSGAFSAVEAITINIGTAGSTALVLQALLGVLPFGTTATVIGGTNVDYAPPTDHVELVLAPILALWGIKLTHDTLKRGVFPKGGGMTRFSIDRTGLKPFQLTERGEITRVLIRVVSASAKLDITSFVKAVIANNSKVLHKDLVVSEFICDPLMTNKTQILVVVETSSGSRLSESIILQNLKKEIPESDEAVNKFLARISGILTTHATFDEHTADQVLLFMALATNEAATKPDCGHDGISSIRVENDVVGVDHMVSAMEILHALMPNIKFEVIPDPETSTFIIRFFPKTTV